MDGIIFLKEVKFQMVNRACGEIIMPVKLALYLQRVINNEKYYTFFNCVRMSPKVMTDLSSLCIHTITTKPWNIEEAAKNYSQQVLKELLFGVMHWTEEILNKQETCCVI